MQYLVLKKKWGGITITNMNTRMFAIYALAFGFALALLVFLADQGLLPRQWYEIIKMPGLDKIGHFILMGFFSFLVNVALAAETVRIGPVAVLKGSLIVVLIVTLEEFSQVFVTARSCSVTDLLCDYAGIYCFGRLAVRLMRRAGLQEPMETDGSPSEGK